MPYTINEGRFDFALPAAALPLVWQRTYSSYVNAEHGGACGVLGHGWHVPTEYRLEPQAQRTLLHDTHGRVITFDEALPSGAILHSPSEGLWLLRGGATKDTAQDEGAIPARRPPGARLEPSVAPRPPHGGKGGG
jgi:hypothetical protein